MKRHFYLSDDLDDLDVIERQLEEARINTPQIHVLSENDSGVHQHRLNEVEAVLKKDVVHGTELGAVIGTIGAALVIALSWFSGIADTTTWVPPIFLAIIVLGFCTWEGGLIGIQAPNSEFKRFQDDLRNGKHVLFVDFDAKQEDIVHRVIAEHPKLQYAGEGSSPPRWFVSAQNLYSRFMQTAPNTHNCGSR